MLLQGISHNQRRDS